MAAVTICPLMNGYKKKKKRLTHSFPKAGPSRSYFARSFLLYFLTASPSLFCLLTLVPHCCSPSGSIKEPDIQTMTRWLLWDIRLPSSWSANSLKKVVLFALTHCLSDLLDCRKESRVRLDLVTNSLQPSTAEYTCICVSHLVMSESLQPHGL